MIGNQTCIDAPPLVPADTPDGRGVPVAPNGRLGMAHFPA
jgi:hypothetical protein